MTPSALEAAEHPDDLRKLLATPAGKVMNSDVVTIEPDAELVEAIDLMLEHKIGAIPVIEGGSRKLLGIVSYIDILRAAREYL